MSNKQDEKFSIYNPDAAGIDIGGSSHFVAVPTDRDARPVREFNNFTANLYELADWLSQCRIKTVAMESTGVYWIPLYELLESRGFEVFLVNAHHVKNVPGRKSDVIDCQWIQRLHSYGLLQASFRPTDEICQLRAYMRQRQSLIQYASQHVQHMQKALAQMNVQLCNVVDDITGVTGMKIIRAIIAGERCPHTLASYRDRRCKQPQEVIAKALQGHYRAEHLFALQQAVELFDTYRSKVADCDNAVERLLNTLVTVEKKEISQQPAKKIRRRNELHFEARHFLKQLVGVDLIQVDGLDAHSALRLIAEIGCNMDNWPTDKHFGSWLGLAPGTKISGGKRLSRQTKPSANRAAQVLRIAASTLHRSTSALGAFLRRQKAKLGAPKAITATAYKLARIIYSMIKGKKEYVDCGQEYYNLQYKEKVINNMHKKAHTLGFQLIPIKPLLQEVP